VTLIERETLPVHKICGEFLSQEAQSYLSRLGLDVGIMGGAPISRLRLVRGAQKIEAELPFRGVGISRRKLDEALLQHAGSSGAGILRGRAIRSLDPQKLVLEVENQGVMAPRTLLLATGKHELRGAKRQATTTPDLIGFKMYFRLGPAALAALAEYIQLIFFPGGYAGLQLIEDGIANLCLLISRAKFVQIGGTWPEVLEYVKASSPFPAEILEDAAPLLAQPLTIFRVPYGFFHRVQRDDSPRLFRLGDQACVIHSFTGDGMAIALHSAALAVQSCRQGDDAASYHRRLRRDVGTQLKRADALYALLHSRLSQPAIFAMASLWPGSLKIAAAATRVPLRARL
jgi:flavin-dependent dehydrogenase